MVSQTPSTAFKPLNAYAYATVSSNGETTGDVIDTLGFTYATFCVCAGTFTSSAAAAIKITESSNSDGSSPTDITGAAFTSITTSNDVAWYFGRVYLPPGKRYLRMSVTHSGTGNALLAAAVILSGPEDTALQTVTYSFGV